jgi:phosphatidate cytidylyltransferase
MNQNLKSRIITAIIGVAVILFLLLGLGIEGVALFAWVVSLGMLYEFCRMFFNLEDANRKTGLALLTATVIHAFNYVFNAGMSAHLLGLAPVFCFFVVFVFMVPRLLNYGGSEALNSPAGTEKLSKHVQELMALCFGMVYCVWFPMLMVTIRELNSGKFWLLFGLLVVWANDTLAYFGGKYFGKHPLFETVSPKKTKEGALTGVAGALVIGVIFAKTYLPAAPTWIIAIMILGISAASITGDLAESLLKRASQKKDSGSILPGHGGFLDRFDGVAFGIPMLYALLWLFA